MKRSRKLLLIAFLSVILVSSLLVYLKLDFDNRKPEQVFLNVIKTSPAGMQAFQKLDELTPADAVVFSWWDYGLPIQEFGRRDAVVAYPSRDIIQSISGVSRDPTYALEMQLFGTYESSEKIQDVARAFVLPEDESLTIMRKYGATYVMVFPGNDETGAFADWWKFIMIARIAGYNGTDYIHIDPSIGGTLTSKAGQATMMRLMFDDQFQPQHFTKVYENKVAKIYQIDYPVSSLVDSPTLSFVVPSTQWRSTLVLSDNPQRRS